MNANSSLIELLLQINASVKELDQRLTVLEEEAYIKDSDSQKNLARDNQPKFHSLAKPEGEHTKLFQQKRIDYLVEQAAELAILHYKKYPPKRN